MNRVLAGLVLTFVPAAPAVAAQKPITGTLDQPGLTVIALAANGHAVLT
ncbi:MAG: hypothetical protein QOG68_1706, partial [Solirubrobacteraceae bacterium]|nr:hypothetical protein [Solirubrobacteraceae bacterium]